MSRSARSSRQRRRVQLALSLVACLPCCTFPDFKVVLPALGGAGAGGVGGTGNADGGMAGGGTSAGSVSQSGGSAGTEASPGGGGSTAGAPETSAGQSGEANGGASGSGSTSGQLLFFDDFESGNADKWTPTTQGDWSVLSADGTQAYRQGTKSTMLRLSSAGDKQWTNVAVRARVKVLSFGGTNAADLVGLYARFTDLDNYYYAALRSDGRVAMKARIAGSESPLGAAVDIGISANVWYTVLFQVDDSKLSVSVAGGLVQTAMDSSLTTGAIAVGGSNATVLFDDIEVTSL